MKATAKTYRYEVTFNRDGKTVTVEVEARHEFEAVQLAGAFNRPNVTVINLDL